MDAKKQKRLETAGWHAGSAADFLELSAEEAALVETRLATGATKNDLARVLTSRRRPAAA